MTTDHTAPTVAATMTAITERLRRAGVVSPHVDARWLTRHVLGWSAADLVRRADRPLDAEHAAQLRLLADRRAAREPLQLVLGGTEFRAHRLLCRPGVFIPRPETELLVDHALGRLPSGGVLVEACTGSGAVACAIAAERPDVQVVATDVDAAAVGLAKDNAHRLDVAVDVRTGDLLDPVPAMLRAHVDVLVANPPYLAADEMSGLEPEVADWDPPVALVAGSSGHEVSDRLIACARDWLRPGGWLVLELDERRVDEAADRACAAGLVAVERMADLTGRLRFVAARRDRDAGDATEVVPRR